MKALAVLCGLMLWLGCATFKSTATMCAPTPDQEIAILAAAHNPIQAVALAAIDGLGFAECVLKAGVHNEIVALESKVQPGASALKMSADNTPDPTLDNLKAWEAAHP